MSSSICNIVGDQIYYLGRLLLGIEMKNLDIGVVVNHEGV